jgi:hypothetical protein
MSTALISALTEDDETCVEPIGCGLGNLPVSPSFLLRTLAHQFRQCDRRSTSSDRSVRCAIEVKVAGILVEGTEGTVEQNRDGEYGDASLRGLRFQAYHSTLGLYILRERHWAVQFL